MKVPKLQKAISAIFPSAQVLNTIPPDETVAIGCGKQALYVTGVSWDTNGEHPDKEIDTLAKDVYIEYVTGEENGQADSNARELLFGRGAPVPNANKATITRPIKCINGKATIRVVQGDQTEDIERPCEADLKEIRGRIHTTENADKPVIHLHLD